MSNFTEEQREEIKERDNHECQLNKMFGITELTGVSCSKKLEIHHKIYRQGEQFLEDGITVCERCHALFITSIIREIRYKEDVKKMNLNGKFGFGEIKL